MKRKLQIKLNEDFMQILTTPIKVKTLKGKSMKFYFSVTEQMSIQYTPEFFFYSNFIRENISNKMWIKCGVLWSGGINEHAWFEVIEAQKDDLGKITYTAKLDEFKSSGLGEGVVAFGIEPRHI